MSLETRPIRLLASVMTGEEALLAAGAGADIIDCKNPREGALGALPHAVVRDVRNMLPRGIPVSATIGDLPADASTLCAAALDMAATGVDFVKIGFFPGGDAKAAIAALGAMTRPAGCQLVGVLLADTAPDFSLVTTMANASFAGVVLDTAGKSGGCLLDHVSQDQIKSFIAHGASVGMFTGLAGSLRLEHITLLAPLKPDILGFRGALCAARDRTNTLNAAALGELRRALLEAWRKDAHIKGASLEKLT